MRRKPGPDLAATIETARAGGTATRRGAVLGGPRKPTRELAARVLLAVALLVTAGAVLGILAEDMRPLMAAIYFALGFVMQRASFCSASLISAVVLSRDARGLLAITVAVLTAMLGFGLLRTLGLVTVYPGRISVLPAAVGGLLFGTGMVFAGGCVSGSLFKAAEGRWPSMLAVMGILAGMAAATSASGRGAIAVLAGIGSSWNPAPNLAAPDGAVFPHLATGIALVALAAVGLALRRRVLSFDPVGAFPVDRSWPLFGVAIIVGLLGWAALWAGPALGRHYPLGASHIPSSLLRLALHGDIRTVGILAWAFVPGAALSAWLRGEIRWRSAPRDVLVLAFAGGVLVGLGTVMGGGCFVGQILSGWALLSSHALIFGVAMILANWVTTLFYLRGWRS
jgi:uncharacterized membrane protein YedE/YeeE